MLSFRNKTINFYSHIKCDNKEYDTRFLSNLFNCDIIIDENVAKYWKNNIDCPKKFTSSEHIYQAFKPYENEADTCFILGLKCSDEKCELCSQDRKMLSSNDAAKFGQGRLLLKEWQRKWLKHHKSIATYKQKPKINNDGIEWLEKNCADLMMDILRCKFTKDNEMGKKLLQFSGQLDTILFTEHTKNDFIWGDGLDGTGFNFLGKLLTIRLKELVEGKNIDKLDYCYLRKKNLECVKY